MSTVITTAGEQLIAQKIGAGAVLSIDTIILAHIPDLDLDSPVDREQGKPQPEHVVHEYAIPEDFKGYVNPNQVVYSMLLGSEIGNFQFNWLGLYSSADDVLIAVTHLPVTQKWQTDNASNTLGNNLTRNFMLEFSGAKAVTNITVEAKTWQVDFTARLRSIDERERRSSRDIYGRSCFFNDGFSVVKDGSSYVLKAGAGYVEGIRCVQSEDTALVVSTLPTCVFLDVSFQQRGSDIVPVVTPLVAGGASDYVGANNVSHYCIKLAGIDAGGVVWDDRRVEAVATDLVEYLKQQAKDAVNKADMHAEDKEDPHETMKKVATEINKHTSRTDDPHETLPKGGNTGDILAKTDEGEKWISQQVRLIRINIRTFVSSGTYRKPSNLLFAEIWVVGGGGAGSFGPERGGGAGGTSIKTFLASELLNEESVIVGAGGIPNSGNGGDSAFKSMLAKGGRGALNPSVGSEGGFATGGDVNLTGDGGSAGVPGSAGDGGAGGSSFLGGAGSATRVGDGLPGHSGSGGSSGGEVVNKGGAGGDGIVIIKEFLGG